MIKLVHFPRTYLFSTVNSLIHNLFILTFLLCHFIKPFYETFKVRSPRRYVGVRFSLNAFDFRPGFRLSASQRGIHVLFG